MKSLVNQYTVVRFEFIGMDGSVKDATVRIKPEASDWWCTVTREGLTFDIHYCEDYNQIAVYRMGSDQWREKLVASIRIDDNEPFDPMVKPESLYHTLQDAWLNAEGKVSILRDEAKRASDKLAEAYLVAERAYKIYTDYKRKQHEIEKA